MTPRASRLLCPVVLTSLAAVATACGSGSGGEGSSSVGTTGSAISDSANETAFRFFVAKGLTSVQAAGRTAGSGGNADQKLGMLGGTSPSGT